MWGQGGVLQTWIGYVACRQQRLRVCCVEGLCVYTRAVLTGRAVINGTAAAAAGLLMQQCCECCECCAACRLLSTGLRVAPWWGVVPSVAAGQWSRPG
jgi:hypothetical protein